MLLAPGWFDQLAQIDWPGLIHTQLENLRNPDKANALAGLTLRLAGVWLGSCLLLPLVQALCLPGPTLPLRLIAPILALCVPTVWLASVSISGQNWLGWWLPGVWQVCSAVALLSVLNVAPPAQLTAASAPRLWMSVHLPRQARLIGPALALSLLLTPLPQAGWLALLLRAPGALWLAKRLAQASLPNFQPGQASPISEAIVCLLMLIWLLPLGLIDYPAIGPPSWLQLALLIPALAIGLVFGLLTAPPWPVLWLAILAMPFLGLEPHTRAEHNLAWLVALFALHTTLIGWLVHLGWSSYSRFRSQAVYLVHSRNPRLWLRLLARPLAQSCVVGLLLAAYAGLHNGVGLLLLAIGVALGVAVALLLRHPGQ